MLSTAVADTTDKHRAVYKPSVPCAPATNVMITSQLAASSAIQIHNSSMARVRLAIEMVNSASKLASTTAADIGLCTSAKYECPTMIVGSSEPFGAMAR